MRLFLSLSAQKELFRLPDQIQERIVHKIKFFTQQENPLLFAKHIGGKIYRFRVGNYRILFEILDEALHVAKIDRRDKTRFPAVSAAGSL